VSFFLALLLFIIVPEFTELAYGQKWLPIVPIFQLLILYSLLRPVYDTTGSIMVATGRERTLAKISIVLSAFMLFCVAPLIYFFWTTGAAVGIGVMILIGFILQSLQLSRRGGTVSINYFGVFAVPMLSLLVATAVALALPQVASGVIEAIRSAIVPAVEWVLSLLQFIKQYDVQRISYLCVVFGVKVFAFTAIYAGLLLLLERGKLFRQGKFLYETLRAKTA
jgi:O-antigen/teichoic acid export membrane protein